MLPDIGALARAESLTVTVQFRRGIVGVVWTVVTIRKGGAPTLPMAYPIL